MPWASGEIALHAACACWGNDPTMGGVRQGSIDSFSDFLVNSA